jgi:hypothetical protein
MRSALKVAAVEPGATVTVAGTATLGVLLVSPTGTNPAVLDMVTPQFADQLVEVLLTTQLREFRLGVDHSVMPAV